jgi:hypothetical protein
VLNGQVKNQKEYFDALSNKPIEIPYLRMRRYTPKTLRGWLYQYLRGGIEALKPGYRSDRGKYRKIDFELSERIKQKKLEHPEMPNKHGVVDDIFTPSAYEAIHSLTKGLPRIINNLATASLLYAYSKRLREIDEEVIYQAQNEISL